MKNIVASIGVIVFLIVAFSLCSEKDKPVSKSSEATTSTVSSDEYIKSIISTDAGIYKATITDANLLVIAVAAEEGVNFDMFAKTYLSSALKAGLKIKGCLIVNINNCQFQEGAVIGKRIGKAYK